METYNAMSSRTLTWAVIGVIVLAAVLYVFWLLMPLSLPFNLAPTATSTAEAVAHDNTFYCAQAKTLVADFSPQKVALKLSDGRSLALAQTISGSGARYEATSTGTDIVFWNEGDTAFVTENGTTTYENCIVAKITPVASDKNLRAYADASGTFSFTYPAVFTPGNVAPGYTSSWMYGATTTGMLLAEIEVPSNYEPGTNFAGARLTVGTASQPDAISECLTYYPLRSPSVPSQTVTLNSSSYVKFVGGDAGAGNFYKTTSYHILRDKQCYVVEYTVHSLNLGNFSPSQHVRAFDEAKVTNALAGTVATFKFLK